MTKKPSVVQAPAVVGRETERLRRKRLDAKRPSSSARGYDWQWGKLAKRFKAANPLCRRCLELGDPVAARGTPDGKGGLKPNEVDHIIPISRAPHLRLEWMNLQTLCSVHHKRKTAQQDSTFAVGAHGSRLAPGA